MNPDNEATNPIDPPENTGGGTTAAEESLDTSEAQAMAIDPPDNTGGGT